MNSPKLKAPSSEAHLKYAPQQCEFPKLSWDDFQAQPVSGNNLDAYSYWSVSYTYKARFEAGEAVITAQAKCVFEKHRSWVKNGRKSQELLQHEQGHYYIGSLCALNFMKRVKSTSFSNENYKGEVDRLFQETLQEFLQLEKLYDEETCHFKNKEQQRRWNQRINYQIEELRSFWWPEILNSENVEKTERIEKVEKSERHDKNACCAIF